MIKVKTNYDILERLSKEGTVKVGIMGAEAAADHGGATTAEVASKHEFGVDVPRRSWLRDPIDRSESKLKKRLRNIGKQVISGDELENGLELFGSVLVGELQENISNRIPPPLSQATIEQKTNAQGKSASVPLIRTGQMRSSITYAVKVK
jgi:hypothetical protein